MKLEKILEYRRNVEREILAIPFEISSIQYLRLFYPYNNYIFPGTLSIQFIIRKVAWNTVIFWETRRYWKTFLSYIYTDNIRKRNESHLKLLTIILLFRRHKLSSRCWNCLCSHIANICFSYKIGRRMSKHIVSKQ